MPSSRNPMTETVMRKLAFPSFFFCLSMLVAPISSAQIAYSHVVVSGPKIGLGFNGSYNPFGGIKVGRIGVGKYSVYFIGLGKQRRSRGHAQVSAVSSRGHYCNIERWRKSGSNFRVDVQCFSRKGRSADSDFTVLAGWPRSSGRSGRRVHVPTLDLPRRPCRGDNCDKSVTDDVEELWNAIDRLNISMRALREAINAAN